MKIALVNYRYFISGGPERYMFNIKELLEREGHRVVTFSVKSPKNEPSPYDKYYLESVGGEEQFADTPKTVGTVLKSFTRMFYSPEAYRKFSRLLRDERPDIVYILQYHNKISPSILYAARKAGIPVVHRISDFQYMCPNALFHNNRTGVCEDCLNGRRLSCVRNRCVLDSALYSAIKVAAKGLHDMLHITRKIDAFVVPSTFTAGKLRQYGIPAEKLHHIPTFFNLKGEMPAPEYEPFFLYIGRIERQKGVGTLVEAFADTEMRLKIVGFSADGYDEELKVSLKGKRHNIEFLGRKPFDEIVPLLNTCMATIMPAEGYDNFPNTILESFAYSKAVIASALGSLLELVHDGETGLTFKPGDPADLRRCAAALLANPAEARRMGANARTTLEEKYTPGSHYKSLIALFKSLIKK